MSNKSCARCGMAIHGSGARGEYGLEYCGPPCRDEDKMEVAARLGWLKRDK